MSKQPDSPDPISRSRFADAALCALFLTAISLPILVPALGVKVATLAENRNRASRPTLEFTWEALAQYPSKFEAYFNDAFGFRDELIRWNSLAKVTLMKVSPSSRVVIGKRGWLYYADEYSIDDYRHTIPMSAEQLEKWRQAFVARRDWLARQGIHYMVMIAPNKHTIYPEFVPDVYHRVRPESRLDQLYGYLREHTDLTLVDFREPLMKAKANGRLYYRRDTHWNDRGAFVAYQVILNALSRWYPGVQPLPRTAYRPVKIERPNPDLSLILGLTNLLTDREVFLHPRFTPKAHRADPGPELEEDKFPPGAPVPVAFETPGGELPRTVVFRDSFFMALVPLLSEHFARILYIWHCPFDAGIIEREHPQIVIEEAIERRLWYDAPPHGVPDEMIARK